MLISKVDNDWLIGYLEGNVMQQGLFPSNFVDIIVNLKEEDSKEKVKKCKEIKKFLPFLPFLPFISFLSFLPFLPSLPACLLGCL